jgi:phospholipid transport system transporter-binding protein
MSTDSINETANSAAAASGVITVSGPMTVYTVETLRDQFLERLNAGEKLTVDLAGVDACDCAGLQLLCAAHKSVNQSGKGMSLLQVSQAILDAARDAGLDVGEFLDTTKSL